MELRRQRLAAQEGIEILPTAGGALLGVIVTQPRWATIRWRGPRAVRTVLTRLQYS